MACVQCDSMPIPGSSVTAEYRWGWTQADRTWHRRSHAAAQATDKPQDERCRRQASQRGLRPPAHLPSVSQQAATVVSGSPPRGSRPSSHLHTQNGAQRTQDNEATEVPITPGQTHRAAAWTVGSSDRGHPARTDAKHRAGVCARWAGVGPGCGGAAARHLRVSKGWRWGRGQVVRQGQVAGGVTHEPAPPAEGCSHLRNFVWPAWW